MYALIAVLAFVENVFPPLPADTAVALGAFLSGRGVLDARTVFGIGWAANVGGATAVYWLGRRYGRDFFTGRVGKKLLPEPVLAHIAAQYHRHGTYGIFLSRLLPVWRAVVPPFAGIAGLSPARTLIPLAVASALWYAALTFLVATLGANFDDVLHVLDRMNQVLMALAVATVVLAAIAIRRLLRR